MYKKLMQNRTVNNNQITEDDMKIIKDLAKKISEAEKNVYLAIDSNSLSKFFDSKNKYENACLDMWSFSYKRFGLLPTIKVKISY